MTSDKENNGMKQIFLKTSGFVAIDLYTFELLSDISEFCLVPSAEVGAYCEKIFVVERRKSISDEKYILEKRLESLKQTNEFYDLYFKKKENEIDKTTEEEIINMKLNDLQIVKNI